MRASPPAGLTVRLLVLALCAAALALLLAACGGGAGGMSPGDRDTDGPRAGSEHRPVFVGEAEREGEGEGEEEGEEGSPAEQEVAARAYPRRVLSAAQAIAAEQAFAALPESPPLQAPATPAPGRGRAARAASLPATWRFMGPTSITKPPYQSYPSPAHQSGRVTALAVDPDCAPGACRLWVAAAGGGIWRTEDALAATPVWRHASEGITSNAIGAIAIDPNDAGGDTLYAGTGEANVSSDAEAGVGLFKTTDGGDSWTLVPGSLPVARDRSIGAIAIPAGAPDTIWMGTARGRHGRSGFTGASDFTPPGVAPYGVYRSDDGGASFERDFATPASPGDPAERTDPVEGGVSSLGFAPGDPGTLYASVYGHGMYRRSPAVDGDQDWHQVLDPGAVDGETRTEFDTVRVDGDTVRVYAVVGDQGGIAMRSDDGTEPAAGVTWETISSADASDPRFGGHAICEPQCSYDLVVRADPGDPDVVWIGGVAKWDEIPPMSEQPDQAGASFGRTVVRSTDAGATWDDMTVGAEDPATDFGGGNPPILLNGSHPDLHALVLLPSDTDSAFVAGDGGVVRTSAETVDATGTCPDDLDAAFAARCQEWKSGVPAHVHDLNEGLATLQFQRVSASPDGSGQLLGGTQDNGSLAFAGDPKWTGFAQGDGGGNGFDAVDPNVRWHTYYGASTQINLDYAADPLQGWRDAANGLGVGGACLESCAFYAPFLPDPRVGSRAFFGEQHVFRTDDRGTSWQPMGEDLTASAGKGYVSAVGRSVADTGTMWAATATGEVFVTGNADAADPDDVAWLDVGAAPLPNRYPTGIAVDPEDPLHAFIAFSGYEAYTPGQPGHVFEARFDPQAGTAAFTDVSADLGDVPVLDIAYDPVTQDLWLATDWGVARRPGGESTWKDAAEGMPLVAVYGLAMDPVGRTIYAATHGRGVYQVDLPGAPFVPPAPIAPPVTPEGPPPSEPPNAIPDEPEREPAAAQPVEVRIALAGGKRTLRMSRSGVVRVRLRPFAEAVRGRAELLVKRGGRRHARRVSQRPFKAAANARVRLTMRLDRRGRTFVREHRRVTAWLRVTVRARAGSEKVRRVRITVRAARSARR